MNILETQFISSIKVSSSGWWTVKKGKKKPLDIIMLDKTLEKYFFFMEWKIMEQSSPGVMESYIDLKEKPIHTSCACL